MEVKKIVTLNKDEVKKLLTKFVEKKVKNTVLEVVEDTDGGLEFHITPTALDEAGE